MNKVVVTRLRSHDLRQWLSSITWTRRLPFTSSMRYCLFSHYIPQQEKLGYCKTVKCEYLADTVHGQMPVMGDWDLNIHAVMLISTHLDQAICTSTNQSPQQTPQSTSCCSWLRAALDGDGDSDSDRLNVQNSRCETRRPSMIECKIA